jgi:hypothetical protein
MSYPEINQKTKEYWREEDFFDLEKVQSFGEMFLIAKRVIERMPKELVQVCGPITSGGLGSVEENLHYLNNHIQKLQDSNIDVFDQMPFESTIHRLFNDPLRTQKHDAVLTDFYLPLFTSGVITSLYFVPGWESSRGANWEHEKAKELKLSIVYL